MNDTHMISVRLAEPYWRSAGQRDLELEMPIGSLVRDVVAALLSLYPSLEKELKDAPPVIFISEEEANLDSPLQGGDRVYFVWPIAGGGNVLGG